MGHAQGMTENLVDILIGIVIFIALFGFILTSLNGFTWSAVNAGGTVVNLSWAPYVLVILLVVGLVYLGFRMIKKK